MGSSLVPASRLGGAGASTDGGVVGFEAMGAGARRTGGPVHDSSEVARRHERQA
jgi:hypothetical protein